MPLYPLSCESYRAAGLYNGDFRREVTIDIDGSGALEPFSVSSNPGGIFVYSFF